MNTVKRYLSVLMVTAALLSTVPQRIQAQCAMCSLTAENATQNGNSQGKGLNKGILFLLAIPYLAAVGIGVLWYKRYRAKKTVNVEDEPIVLN